MGCDLGVSGDHVPYCKPKCVQFRLVVTLDKVKAQCVRCSLHHEFTVHGGQIMIEQEESKVTTGEKR